MTVKDAIGPQAFFVFQCIGYTVFVSAAWFVIFALCRASADVRQYRRYMGERNAPACRVLTLVRNSGQEEPALLFRGVIGARTAHSRHGGRNGSFLP